MGLSSTRPAHFGAGLQFGACFATAVPAALLGVGLNIHGLRNSYLMATSSTKIWKTYGLSPYFCTCFLCTNPPPMAEKRTMTLNLTDAEMSALEELAVKKDLNKTVVIRQALRLYQMVDQRLREGKKVFIEDEMTKSKSELMLL